MSRTWRPASRRFTTESEQEQQERKLLHPPGADATASKAEKFAGLVSNALEDGLEVELCPWGVTPSWHCVRALSTASTSADFEVSWAEDDHGERKAPGWLLPGQGRRLRLLARKGKPWEAVAFDTEKGSFVSKETQVVQLARSLAVELRKDGRALLHSFADSEVAVCVMIRALATVPLIEETDGAALRCCAKGLQRPGEASPRVFVHAELLQKGGKEGAGTRDFVAYPPGGNPDGSVLENFRKSVLGRLGQQQPVALECRGKDAAVHAIDALASIQHWVAEVEMKWVSSSVWQGEGRALRLRALPAETWAQFNATDFLRTHRLKCSPSSDIALLARAIGNEVKKLGGVAVHAFADDPGAVHNALKAIASVPVQVVGVQVVSVPSLGWVRHPSSSEGRRLLRLYVRARRRR